MIERMRKNGDDGFATIWAVGGTAILLLITVAALALVGATASRHRAASAADLAAVAAAWYAPFGEQAACQWARQVTGKMHVALDRCWLAGWDALVEVSADLPSVLSGLGHATARARAGPVADARSE